MTQTDIIENILSDRQWHSGIFIAQALGGSCSAYRSRISCDLKPRLAQRGLMVFSRKPQGSKIWEYRIGEMGELGL